MIIRLAGAADADGVNAVYNPYVLETAATFETEPITTSARLAWLAERSADPRYPVFVAEDPAGRIAGFANASPFDPRQAYGTSVKVSVFLAPGAQRQGLGAALYAALFRRLADADLHRAYALIVAPNPASVSLHQQFGFRQVSTLSEVGRKFGRYWDVMWFEKKL